MENASGASIADAAAAEHATRSSWILHHTHVSVEVTAASVLFHRL
eukprot:SAG11_NODE_13738_length_641_cov_2.509225_1_plen_44_part_10